MRWSSVVCRMPWFVVVLCFLRVFLPAVLSWRISVRYLLQLYARGTGVYNNRKRYLNEEQTTQTLTKKQNLFAGLAWVPHVLVTIYNKTAFAACCKMGGGPEILKNESCPGWVDWAPAAWAILYKAHRGNMQHRTRQNRTLHALESGLI